MTVSSGATDSVARSGGVQMAEPWRKRDVRREVAQSMANPIML